MGTPKSLLAGLMWFDPHRPDALSNVRHSAQERDGQYLFLCVHPLVKQASSVLLSVCGRGQFSRHRCPLP